MRQVDERRLESDLMYRFEFVSQFIGFAETNIAAIHASAAHPVQRS